jgi:D-alanine transaminase
MTNIPSNVQAYYNGAFLPLDQVSISPFDRGFLFGDGVYEVIVSYDSKPFYLDQHMERLERSLKFCRIAPQQDMTEIVEALFEKNRHLGNHLACYLQISRGVDYPRQHQHSSNVEPTIFGYCFAPVIKSFEDKKTGLSLKTVADIRWLHCDIKAITLLPNGLAKQQAIDLGYDDALQIREDEVKETSSGNIFFVKQNTLYTPESDNEILHGVTRKLLSKIAKAEALELVERKIFTEELTEFTGAFLCSTISEITPITQIDEYVYSLNEDLYTRLHLAFNALK